MGVRPSTKTNRNTIKSSFRVIKFSLSPRFLEHRASDRMRTQVVVSIGPRFIFPVTMRDVCKTSISETYLRIYDTTANDIRILLLLLRCLHINRIAIVHGR